jgi:hypothetical protein
LLFDVLQERREFGAYARKGKAGVARVFFCHNGHVGRVRNAVFVQAEIFAQQSLYAVTHNCISHLSRDRNSQTRTRVARCMQKNKKMLRMTPQTLFITGKKIRAISHSGLAGQGKRTNAHSIRTHFINPGLFFA